MPSLQTLKPAAPGLAALVFLLLTGPAWAEAGRVMYVSGEASLTRGGVLPINKGMAVEPGDVIETGTEGRVQLLMADGDRIALRPSTRFIIDEFSGPSRSKPGESVLGTRPTSWKSFYTLARGGFRTLTQSLGERDSSSYQVRTPVATIGIRGTDYTLLYCPATDCSAYKGTGQAAGIRVEGMHASVFRESAVSRVMFAAIGTSWVQEYLKAAEQGSGGSSRVAGKLLGGVSNGEIEVTDPNGNGHSVKNDEFFQTDGSGFEKLPGMPDELNDQTNSEGEGSYEEQVGEGEGEEGEFSSRTSPNEGVGDGAGGMGGGATASGYGEAPTQAIGSSGGDLTNGQAPPPNSFTTAFRGLVLSYGPYAVVENMEQSSARVETHYKKTILGFDGAGKLNSISVKFPESDSLSTLALVPGQSAVVNDGFDIDGGPGGENSNTGLRWGRWTGKLANSVTDANGTFSRTIDLGQSSLHWIYGPDTGTGQAPALPMGGHYSYTLVGNTNPTDNHGNIGALTAASFSADFDYMGVYSSLEILLNDDQWHAYGSGSIDGPSGTFSGTYDVDYCGECSGTGEFSGFFTPGGDASNAPPGAGLGYHLQGGGTDVSGVAAFGDPSPSYGGGIGGCDGECGLH